MGRSKIIGALPRMPLQVLKYVISISEYGSTLAAAHDVHLTSSALSRQVAQLEHELGVSLFERHSRGMRPTSAGEVFIEAARQVLRRMDQLAADLDDVHSLKRGHVTIYASEALVPDYLIPRISVMARTYPNIKADIVVASGRQAERALLEERADLAVVFSAASHSELEIVAEHRSQVVAIVSHEHDLAAHGAVAAVDLLDGMCLALPPRNYATRLAFDALLPPEKAGIVPHLTVNSIAALKLYARSGAGVAVVPSFAVSGENVDAALVTLELEGAERNGTRVCLCRHSNRQLSAAAIYVLEDIAAAFPRLAELL